MRKLIISLLIAIIFPPLAGGQTFPYRDQHSFALGSDKGQVSIKLDQIVLRRGLTYRLQYTFDVINSSYAVYNWQFISLKPLPGQLAIYDVNKQYIGDLIAFDGGSQAGISDDDWTFLYGESHIGKPLGFRAGLVPNTRYDSTGDLLMPGTYYIQLIMYKAFLSPNPFRVEGKKIDFYKTFDRSELCRSNAIKIDIVDK